MQKCSFGKSLRLPTRRGLFLRDNKANYSCLVLREKHFPEINTIMESLVRPGVPKLCSKI